MALTTSQIQDYYKTQTSSATPLSPAQYEASLAAKPTAPAVTSPQQATSSSTQLRSTLAGQGVDVSGAPMMNFDQFKAAIAPTAPPPVAPNTEAEFTNLRASTGLQSLEDQYTGYDAQIATLQDKLQANTNQSIGGETQGFVTGQAQTENAKVQMQIDSLTRKQGVLNDQIKFKNDFISQTMSNTKTDYETALTKWNTSFNQALSLQSAFDTYQNKQITEEQRVMTNARGTITAMTNLMANSGMTIQDILKENPAFSNQLNTLELQSGYPVGFVETFANSKPRANIIATYDSTDENGNKFVAIVSQDSTTGAPTVSRIYTGGVSTGTPAAFKSDAFTAAQGYFQTGTEIGGVSYNGIGGDGYVDPNLYSILRTQYGNYRNVSEFDAEFGHLVNPASRVEVGLDKPKTSTAGTVSVTNAKGVTVSVQ